MKSIFVSKTNFVKQLNNFSSQSSDILMGLGMAICCASCVFYCLNFAWEQLCMGGFLLITVGCFLGCAQLAILGSLVGVFYLREEFRRMCDTITSGSWKDDKGQLVTDLIGVVMFMAGILFLGSLVIITLCER